jgi:hypothetical protein
LVWGDTVGSNGRFHVRTFLVTVVTCLTLGSVAGCGPLPKSSVQSKPKASPTHAAPAYLGEPKVGECHNLTAKQIQKASDTIKPVPCTQKHTTVTVAVVTATKETNEAKGDDRTFAVGQACGPGFTEVLGGDSKTRAKTLYSLAWFNPTKAQAAKGAKWLRCDVALTAVNRAFPITGKQPLLDDGPKDSELACGRRIDGKVTGWIFVPCSTKHEFEASAFVEADPKTDYKDAEKAAKKACVLKGGLYSWSHADQWGIGDRWYVCWNSDDPSAGDPGVLALGTLR